MPFTRFQFSYPFTILNIRGQKTIINTFLKEVLNHTGKRERCRPWSCAEKIGIVQDLYTKLLKNNCKKKLFHKTKQTKLFTIAFIPLTLACPSEYPNLFKIQKRLHVSNRRDEMKTEKRERERKLANLISPFRRRVELQNC